MNLALTFCVKKSNKIIDKIKINFDYIYNHLVHCLCIQICWTSV